ncbi:MAG: TPM domain-containing protein [Pseudomonadota bacterium]
MALLNSAQQQKIADQIRDIESRTDAELVTVLASRSDNYNYVSLMWAAVLALLVPIFALMLPFWLNTRDIVLLQCGLFLVLALLFRIPAILYLIVPKRIRYWRAANMARRAFLDNNLHHTMGESGILIFVSEAERYVEIIADRGLDKLVTPGQWQELVDEFILAVKKGDTFQGFENCLRRCGDELISKLPITQTKDELPNHLVMIE